MFNKTKKIIKQPALLAAIPGFINPVTIAIGAAGFLAYALYKTVTDNAAKEPLPMAVKLLEKPLNEPLPSRFPTVQSTVSNGHSNRSNTAGTLSDEALRKEMIRQAMSELGKRSAAARARKRDNQF